MLMQNFICMGIVSVIWVLFVFSLAFGHDVGGTASIGRLHPVRAGTCATNRWPEQATGVPTSVFAAFQLMFAVITPALITGAIADRMKFGAFCVFVSLWLVLVYSVVAHWVWGRRVDRRSSGTRSTSPAAPWSTSTPVSRSRAGDHPGQARGLAEGADEPHNVPFVLLGAGLLWFGWFGFNAGSGPGR